MSDTETHIHGRLEKKHQECDRIMDDKTAQDDPSKSMLKCSKDRVSLPPLKWSHQPERKTDTEGRYVRTPTRTTGAPPLPAGGRGQSLAGDGHSEEHLGRCPLNASSPIKAPMPNVEKIPWYHPNLSRADAENLLLQSGITEGTYLLRSSQSMSDFLTLSVRKDRFVSHSRVQWDGQQFCFGHNKFPDVESFQDHLEQQPVIRLITGDGGETSMHLTRPYIQKTCKLPHYDENYIQREREKQELQAKLLDSHPKSKFSVERPEDIDLQKNIHQISSQEFHFQEEKEHYEDRIKDLQEKLKNAVTAIHQLQQQVNQLRSEPASSRQQHPAESPLSEKNMDAHLFQRREVNIQDQIGIGGWGVVAKGVFRGQSVAVKRPHNALLSKQVVQRLEREMRIMAAVRHPNLVRFLGGVLDEQAHNLQAPPLIILELLDKNLRTAYEQHQVTVANKLIIFRDIAYALHYLHEYQEPIIHRDVSSPNILLESLSTGIWKAKLSDFGSANLACRSVTVGEGAFMYSAPEMFMTSDIMSPALQSTKVDVYSYGVVLCEVAAEKLPEAPNYHFQSLLPRVRGTWRAIHDLVTSCTKRSPRERPTMAAVIDNLCTISLPMQ